VKQYLPFGKAQGEQGSIDWDGFRPVAPSFIGTKSLMDMTWKLLCLISIGGPFFIAWELHGKFPQILTRTLRLAWKQRVV